MIGFSAKQRDYVGRVLSHTTEQVHTMSKGTESAFQAAEQPVWKIADFREANALLLQAPYSPSGVLHFETALDSGSPVAVSLSELAIPYAIQWTPPCAIPESERLNVREVSVTQPQSVQQALQYFETALRPLRALFAVAELIDGRRSEFDAKHVFHLVRNNSLECIVDVAGRRIMLRDGIRSLDLYAAHWLKRPLSASTLPPGFSVWRLDEAAWIYALHGSDTVLPRRYKKSPIYFLRLPRVRSGFIYPRHSVLMEHLSSKPRTFDQLGRAAGVDAANLERDLAALYQCRAITTEAQKLVKQSGSDGGNSGLFSRSSTKTATEQAKELQTVTGPLI